MAHRLIIVCMALLVASPASAEVADKVVSVGALWAWALAFNVIAVVLEVVRPRLGLLVVPIAAFAAWAGHLELSDPYVGPAILRELGPNYVSTSYATFAVGLLGPLIVVVLCGVVRRQKG